MEPEPLQQVGRTCVRYKGRKLSYFAGCDYFRLASHPAIEKAIVGALRKYGGNVAASRLTTGNHILYSELEAELRRFFGAPAALAVSNGYATNLVVAQALAGDFSHAYIDARAHVSLRDAACFLDCPVTEFPHRDAGAAARLLTRRKGRSILLTDGMFSGDGAIAPLAEYLKALPRGGLILLDDAHGAGTLGEHGGGTVELANVPRERIVQTITLSKAFGSYGGAVLCGPELRERIVARSRMFSGSTPAPLPLVAAACRALKLLRDSSFRQRLNANASFVKTRLRKAGFALPENPGPIIPIAPRDGAHAAALRKALLAHGVFPSFIKYPGGPADGYYRFVISSEHSHGQLENLAQALESSHD